MLTSPCALLLSAFASTLSLTSIYLGSDLTGNSSHSSTKSSCPDLRHGRRLPYRALLQAENRTFAARSRNRPELGSPSALRRHPSPTTNRFSRTAASSTPSSMHHQALASSEQASITKRCALPGRRAHSPCRSPSPSRRSHGYATSLGCFKRAPSSTSSRVKQASASNSSPSRPKNVSPPSPLPPPPSSPNSVLSAPTSPQ